MRDRLDSFLETEFPRTEYPRILEAGEPSTEIAEAARAFDLVVMPTHAGRFRRMLLGSTTAKVLDDVDCPILTSKHAETILPRPLIHRELLCAIGMEEGSERVLHYAYQASLEAHANLRIVHAIPAVESQQPIQLDLEELIQPEERREAREWIDDLQKRVGSHAPVQIVVGPVKESLLDAATEAEADVVIMGRSPQPGTQGRLRDLTYAIVRDSPSPVLSV